MYTPRDYQQNGIDSCIEILTSPKPRREIVVSPTAGGKSLYVAFAAKALKSPIIILQPSKELLKQNYQKYIDLGGEAEIYSASLKSLSIGKVTFATIGSIINKVEEVKKLGVKNLIIDECHLGTQSNSQIRRFINGVGIKNVLGLTATPVYLKGGMDGAELKMMNRVKGSLFKDIAHVTQISELVSKKFWSRLDYNIEDQDVSFLRANSNGSDFTKESQKEFYDGNNLKNKVIEHVKNLRAEGRKSILIFVPTIDEAEELGNVIPRSAVVHSKLKPSERDSIIDSFRNLEIDVVINVNILSVGFDHPQLDAIITCRSTMSIAIFYQQIGRGVRIFPGKESCKIIDLSENVKKFGIVEDLNFTKIDGWGWGLFNKDVLLSNYPMSGIKRPTKDSLFKSVERKRIDKRNSESLSTKRINILDAIKMSEYSENGVLFHTGVKDVPSTIIWFGKYNGKTVKEIHKENNKYFPWMIDNFEWKGLRMNSLKKEINILLKL